MQPAALVSQAPHIRRLSTPRKVRKVRGGSWCPRQQAREDAAAHPTGAELADARTPESGPERKSRLQPFSRKSRTPTAATEFQIGLCWVV